MKDFAEQLKQARVAKGWTQRELAERASIRTETVCRVEQRRALPEAPTAVKLARALRMVIVFDAKGSPQLTRPT